MLNPSEKKRITAKDLLEEEYFLNERQTVKKYDERI